MENETKPDTTPAPAPHAGVKTSEYWVTVAFAAILVLAAVVGFAIGKIEWDRAAELLTMGLGILGLGYGASRGLAKAGQTKPGGGK